MSNKLNKTLPVGHPNGQQTSRVGGAALVDPNKMSAVELKDWWEKEGAKKLAQVGMKNLQAIKAWLEERNKKKLV